MRCIAPYRKPDPKNKTDCEPAKSRAAQKGPDGGRYGATQATVMAAYLSEPITFSIASTGFIPTHCIT